MGGCRNRLPQTFFVLPDMISGGILLWSGSIASIPAGYVLCDGNNGSPDLRDKFIVGAKQDDGGIAKTNITGALLQSGGNISHTHVMSSVVGAPLLTGGALQTEAAVAVHIPTFYSLAYIMKT